MVPKLTHPGCRDAWYELEVAKRRVLYSLLNLGLPVGSKLDDNVQGLVFEFRADPVPK